MPQVDKPALPADERAAFEAWFEKHDFTSYRQSFREELLFWMWAAWQARAEQPASPAAPPAEPVAWVVQSKRDGSYFDEVAVVGWWQFDRQLERLRTHPWVIAGVAAVVPLYAAPAASPAQTPVALLREALRKAVFCRRIHNAMTGDCRTPDFAKDIWRDVEAALAACREESGDKS